MAKCWPHKAHTSAATQHVLRSVCTRLHNSHFNDLHEPDAADKTRMGGWEPVALLQLPTKPFREQICLRNYFILFIQRRGIWIDHICQYMGQSVLIIPTMAQKSVIHAVLSKFGTPLKKIKIKWWARWETGRQSLFGSLSIQNSRSSSSFQGYQRREPLSGEPLRCDDDDDDGNPPLHSALEWSGNNATHHWGLEESRLARLMWTWVVKRKQAYNQWEQC